MKENNQQSEHWKVLVLLLKEIAESKGITQQSIASETGLVQSNISRFFSLRYKPNLDVFLQVARAIGVNFFFDDKDSTTDLSVLFNKAMDTLYRRNTDSISKN